MGLTVGFPIKKGHISYEHADHFDATGNRRQGEAGGFSEDHRNEFEEVTEKLFLKVLKKRQEITKAKEKFKTMDIESLTKRYPLMTYERILDLKGQFQTFDINHDGLIDFNELCHVLDELGDHSDTETRREYFEELDEDHSGAVDFEEYLDLIDSMSSAKEERKGISALGAICQRGTTNAQKLRKLSVFQQIDHGVF